MILDERFIEVIREVFPGEDPVNKLEELCRGTFGGGSGYKLLSIINRVIPPMMPSIHDGGNNDSAVVGLREGHRELSALLFRYAGKPRHQEPEQPKTKRR